MIFSLLITDRGIFAHLNFTRHSKNHDTNLLHDLLTFGQFTDERLNDLEVHFRFVWYIIFSPKNTWNTVLQKDFFNHLYILCECVWSLTVSSSPEMLVWGGSSPASRGSCLSLYGPHPPDSWTTARAAAGTHHDSMTDTGSPKKKNTRVLWLFQKHITLLGGHLGKG